VRVKLEKNLKRKKFGLHPHHLMHQLRQTATDIDGIRAETLGYNDTKNVAASLREGYELVRADEYPDGDFPTLNDGKFAGVIQVGGLLLARIPEEIALQIEAYYNKQTQDKEEAINNDLMKEKQAGMRFSNDSQTRVTFGGTKK
jgi:hypothetical protein